MTRAASRGALVAALLLAAPLFGAVQAQGAVDPRFQPWVGCWKMVTPDDAQSASGDMRPTRACVVPSSSVAGSVDLMLFARDSLVSRTAVPKPGVSTARAIDECTGTETSEFVASDTRVVLRADLTCARGVKRTETGLMSINPEGEWMQLQHQEVSGKSATTVARLRFDAEQTAKLPELKGVATSSVTLRVAVGGTVTANQVLAVAKAVPVSLAETYVAELGLQFKMTGKGLAQLADAGMPSRVIDLMVAMANPQAFQVGPNRTTNSELGGVDGSPVVTSAMREPSARSQCSMDEFCYGARGMGAWGLGWGYGFGLDPWGVPYSRYGFRNAYGMYGAYPYGYGYGMMGYGYGYGYGFPGYYYGYNPVIIVNRPTTGNGGGTGGGGGGVYNGGSTRGRAVNGGGYTRASAPSSGGSGGSQTSSPAASGGGGGTGSGTSVGGSSGSGNGGAARTAKPRGGGL